VRERDHFCAPDVGGLWFWWGKVGLNFFIFRSRGVARKWSRMRTGGRVRENVCYVGERPTEQVPWAFGRIGVRIGNLWEAQAGGC